MGPEAARVKTHGAILIAKFTVAAKSLCWPFGMGWGEGGRSAYAQFILILILIRIPHRTTPFTATSTGHILELNQGRLLLKPANSKSNISTP